MEVEKEQLEEDESEEGDMLKFAVTFVSIIVIFTVTFSIIILNMDIDSDFGLLFGSDCEKCDEDDYYYNGSFVMGYDRGWGELNEI